MNFKEVVKNCISFSENIGNRMNQSRKYSGWIYKMSSEEKDFIESWVQPVQQHTHLFSGICFGMTGFVYVKFIDNVVVLRHINEMGDDSDINRIRYHFFSQTLRVKEIKLKMNRIKPNIQNAILKYGSVYVDGIIIGSTKGYIPNIERNSITLRHYTEM